MLGQGADDRRSDGKYIRKLEIYKKYYSRRMGFEDNLKLMEKIIIIKTSADILNSPNLVVL